MSAPLTTKQTDILDAIKLWMAEHRGTAPTRRELAKACGKSVGNVQAHLKRIAAKGFITVHAGERQGISVNKNI